MGGARLNGADGVDDEVGGDGEDGVDGGDGGAGVQ